MTEYFQFALSDYRSGIRVLHLHIDPFILLEDASESSSACVAQRHRSGSEQLDLLDAGQDADGAASGLFLRRTRLQRLVHAGDQRPLRGQPQQMLFHPSTCQHHRSDRHTLLLHGHTAAGRLLRRLRIKFRHFEFTWFSYSTK